MMSKAQQSIPNHRSISILKVANSLTTTVSCRGAEVYFPMQKVKNTIITNIHRAFKNLCHSGDTLETQTALVPFLPCAVATRTVIPTKTPMGSRGMPSPGAGRREPGRTNRRIGRTDPYDVSRGTVLSQDFLARSNTWENRTG
jgi:hypothetical protein